MTGTPWEVRRTWDTSPSIRERRSWARFVPMIDKHWDLGVPHPYRISQIRARSFGCASFFSSFPLSPPSTSLPQTFVLHHLRRRRRVNASLRTRSADEHSLSDSNCKFTYSDTVLYCNHFSCHRLKIVVEVRSWSARYIT